jgi:uncharacterized protein YeeX (DUF496 family)
LGLLLYIIIVLNKEEFMAAEMTVKELKDIIEKLPDDFKIAISADIGGDRPFNFRELKNISIDVGHSDKVVHFFGDLED